MDSSVYFAPDVLARISSGDLAALAKDWVITEHLLRADIIVLSEELGLTLPLYSLCFVKPIVIFQPQLTIPEFALYDADLISIQMVLSQTKDIVQKVRTIRNQPNFDDNIFYGGLTFLWSRDIKMDPVLSQKLSRGYGYLYFDTVLGVLNPEKTISGQEIFRYLNEVDLANHEFFDAAHSCIKCNSILILARDACISCGSVNIDETRLIHHFPCSYNGPERDFIVDDSELLREYVCPKCNKPLRHLGTDYDNTTTVFECASCFHSNSETVVKAKCITCSYENDSQNSPRHNLLSYQISTLGRKNISEPSIFDIPKLMSQNLKMIKFDMFLFLCLKIHELRSDTNLKIVSLDLEKNQSAKFLTDLSEELAKVLRKSDTVSFYKHILYIMIEETGEGTAQDTIDMKIKALGSIFKKKYLEDMDAKIQEPKEFLKEIGGIIG